MLYSTFVINVLFLFFQSMELVQQLPDLENESTNKSVHVTGHSEPAMWSDPVPIALLDTAEFVAQAHPRAVASMGNIYLAFEGVTQFGEQPHSDIYAVTYSSGRWSSPINISQSSVYSGYPQIGLFDDGNYAHVTVLWGEQRGDSQVPDLFPVTDAYYTAHNSGEGWSAPDKFFQSSNRGINFRNITRDNQGRLHYTFTGRQPGERRSVYYIYKIPGESWSSPELLQQGNYTNLIASDKDRLILAYVASDIEYAREHGYDRNSLFVIRSEDRGQSWGEKLVVHQGGEDHPAHDPMLVMDANKVTHLFWLQNPVGESGILSKKIMYAMSTDGIEWEQTKEFLDTDLVDLGTPQYLSAAAIPDGRIFLVIMMFTPGSPNHLLFTWWDGNEWKTPRRILEDYNKFFAPELIYNESDQKLHLIVPMGTSFRGQNRSLYHSTYPLISDPGDS